MYMGVNRLCIRRVLDIGVFSLDEATLIMTDGNVCVHRIT